MNNRNANNNKIILKSQCKGIAACSVRRPTRYKKYIIYGERSYENRIHINDERKTVCCLRRRSIQIFTVAKRISLIERNPNKNRFVAVRLFSIQCSMVYFIIVVAVDGVAHTIHHIQILETNFFSTHFPTRTFYNNNKRIIHWHSNDRNGAAWHANWM